jgi:mono/diheme cytochrome c family protein
MSLTYRSGSRRFAHFAQFILIAALASPASGMAEEPLVFSPPGTAFAQGHFIEADGASLFHSVCQGCHMPDAKGAVGAGHYPALAANPKLASAMYPAITVLQGRHGMPAFGGYMSDAQVAEVVNYVRSHFDNHYANALTAADVKKLR